MRTCEWSFGVMVVAAVVGLAVRAAGEPGPNELTEDEAKDGFVLLFNGKNLDGWKAQSDKHFRVEEGKIIVDGTKGRSMLYYVGPDKKASFRDFELRLQVLTHKGANSGVYFRTKWQDRGYPDRYGYEAQIANTHKNPRKTGSLYKVKTVSDPPTKDDEWFDYHIIVKGREIAIKLNGKTVVEYTEPDDEKKRKPAGDMSSDDESPQTRQAPDAVRDRGSRDAVDA